MDLFWTQVFSLYHVCDENCVFFPEVSSVQYRSIFLTKIFFKCQLKRLKAGLKEKIHSKYQSRATSYKTFLRSIYNFLTLVWTLHYDQHLHSCLMFGNKVDLLEWRTSRFPFSFANVRLACGCLAELKLSAQSYTSYSKKMFIRLKQSFGG